MTNKMKIKLNMLSENRLLCAISMLLFDQDQVHFMIRCGVWVNVHLPEVENGKKSKWYKTFLQVETNCRGRLCV